MLKKAAVLLFFIPALSMAGTGINLNVDRVTYKTLKIPNNNRSHSSAENTGMFAGYLGVDNSPIIFSSGTPSLSYNFISLTDNTDDISFNYQPNPINDFDSNITHIRINPTGIFNADFGGPATSFNVQLRTGIE